MKTAQDLFELSTKEYSSLVEIVKKQFNAELDIDDNSKFLKSPFSIFIHKSESPMAYFVFVKYECEDRANINSLYNGIYKITIDKEPCEIYNIEKINNNRIICLEN